MFLWHSISMPVQPFACARLGNSCAPKRANRENHTNLIDWNWLVPVQLFVSKTFLFIIFISFYIKWAGAVVQVPLRLHTGDDCRWILLLGTVWALKLSECILFVLTIFDMTHNVRVFVCFFFLYSSASSWFNPISWHRYGYSANFEMLNELTRILYCFYIWFGY